MANTVYVCPMHPAVQQHYPGTCPICGMQLVLKSSQITQTAHVQNSYMPLVVIFLLIFLATLTISFAYGFDLRKFIEDFMIGFFLVFSGFKLIDLKGFAEGYSMYDLLAKRVYVYGYLYPFIELLFALAMILQVYQRTILFIEIVVMIFSGVGVGVKLLKQEKFQCACLGTFLKVSLTKVTLVEDFGMAILGIIVLILH